MNSCGTWSVRDYYDYEFSRISCMGETTMHTDTPAEMFGSQGRFVLIMIMSFVEHHKYADDDLHGGICAAILPESPLRIGDVFLFHPFPDQ